MMNEALLDVNHVNLLRLASKHGLRLATLERKMNNMDDPASPALLVVS